MIHKMYSVFDAASQTFGLPFCAITDGLALRSFAEAVNDPSSTLHKYPDQFTLFHVGEFDDSNAFTSIPSTPRSLGLAIEWVKPSANPAPYGHSQVER